MITLPPAPLYSQVAFEVVEVAPHVSEEPEESHASSISHSSEEDTTTFSNKEDTDGVSNYHATYPYYLYAVHPSNECETQNKNCPPTDPVKLAAYNAHKAHENRVALAWFFGILGAIFVAGIIWFAVKTA